MKLAAGRIVIYHVSEMDADALQSHNTKDLPAIVVHAYSDTCAILKIFTDDSTDVLKRSVSEGQAPGQWSWPKREG